jgi:hypothetical protein
MFNFREKNSFFPTEKKQTKTNKTKMKNKVANFSDSLPTAGVMTITSYEL